MTPEDIRRQNAWIKAQRRKGKKGTALLKDVKKPKRPLSAFFEFMLDHRQQYGGGAGITELAKEAGEKWKALSPQEKEVRWLLARLSLWLNSDMCLLALHSLMSKKLLAPKNNTGATWRRTMRLSNANVMIPSHSIAVGSTRECFLSLRLHAS